jgi:guanylate kinase
MGTLVIEKEKIQEMLNKAPDNINIDDFIDEIIITAKIEKALEQLANGEYLTSEQLDEEIKKW